MRVIVQRVSEASVSVDQQEVGSINQGVLILLGIGTDDSEADADWLLQKIVALRIFNDADRVKRSIGV